MSPETRKGKIVALVQGLMQHNFHIRLYNLTFIHFACCHIRKTEIEKIIDLILRRQSCCRAVREREPQPAVGGGRTPHPEQSDPRLGTGGVSV